MIGTPKLEKNKAFKDKPPKETGGNEERKKEKTLPPIEGRQRTTGQTRLGLKLSKPAKLSKKSV